MKHLKYILFITIIGFSNLTVQSQKLTANEIIKKVDANMSSDTQIAVSDMVIHGKRNSRTVTSKGYTRGKHD